MLATQLERIFLFNPDRLKEAIPLADPDPHMTPEEVRHFYAGIYPLLTTATVGAAEIKNDQLVYEFNAALGTKG